MIINVFHVKYVILVLNQRKYEVVYDELVIEIRDLQAADNIKEDSVIWKKEANKEYCIWI